MPTGRPTKYSQELADKICEQLANGESLRSVCAAGDMPAISTVYEWLRVHEGFPEQYARAKDDSADSYAEKIADIGNKVLDGDYDHQNARVAIDALKWAASKLKPKKYGDRIQQDVMVNDYANMDSEQRRRLIAELNQQLSDAERAG